MLYCLLLIKDIHLLIRPAPEKNMRLTWLSLNASYSHSSLALPLAHNACRDLADWEWAMVAATTGDDTGEIAVRLHDSQPDLVCATLYLFNRNHSLDALQRLKITRPECRIAVGGPECLGDEAARLLAHYPFLDFALHGEAEAGLPPLLNAIAAGRASRLAAVPGLAWRQDNTVVDNGGAACFDAWGTPPLPCQSPFFRLDKPFAQVETSRGCPFHCTYCTSGNTPLRLKPLDAVVAELERLRAAGVHDIRLLDRTFNIEPQRTVDLLRLFRDDFPELHFHLEIHPHLLPPAVRAELHAARPGQLHLEVGIQTLRDTTRKCIGRSPNPGQDLDGLAFLCAGEGIDVHVDLLAGCPKQSWDDILQDVLQVVNIGPAEIQLEILKVLPGTPLRQDAADLGLRCHPLPPYDVLQTDSLTPADLLRARLLSRMLDLYHNHPDLQPAFQRACREQEHFLTDFLDCLLVRGLGLGPAPSLRRRFELAWEFAAPRPAVAAELTFAWMVCALPPGLGPAAGAVAASQVPDQAELCFGDETWRRSSRRLRLWQLDLPDRRAWFAYDRAIAPNRAIAAWQQRQSSPPQPYP